MGRPPKLEYQLEQLRRESVTGEGRYVNLRLDFEAEDEHGNATGKIALAVGDRWDRRLGDFDGGAETGVVVKFHPGQRAAVVWFTKWLAEHASRRETPPVFDISALDELVDSLPEHAYSALFAGGRRAGKTWIAVAFCVAYAIMFPGAIVWLVAPSAEKYGELRAYVTDFIARAWLDGETAEGWELCNGSSLLLKSAFGSGDGLKEGKAHLVLLNEGQMMKPRAFVVARGAIVDASGLVIVCANPPVADKDERWVDDFAADATVGTRAAVYVKFNALLNPHIDRRSLLSLKGEVDERTFQIEVMGLFLPSRIAVAYNWVRTENERPVPDDLADVTEAFLAGIGEGPGIKQVIGLDVQRFPYIGGPVYRFYGDANKDSVLAWIVGEVVLDGGDEDDFCSELEERGFAHAQTLIVCDATAEYQHSRRRLTDMEKPEWSGRGSWSVIRANGYTRIVAPDRRMRKKNPAIVDRMRAFTSMIATATDVRRLFADPKLAPRTCQAIRNWKTVHGAPSRTADEAHLGDGVSYPLIRFFPRQLRPLRQKPGSGNPREVNDLAAKIESHTPPAPAVGAEAFVLPPRESRAPRRGLRTRGL